MRTAAEVRELHAAITAIKLRWFDGEIDVVTKRRLIAEEIEFFRGRAPARRVVLTVPRDTGDGDGPGEHGFWWQRD